MEKFKRVEEAINEIRNGKMIVVTDDEGRENEGDLVMAGQYVTPQKINFMATHGKGLICCPISSEYASRLGFHYMSREQDKQGTAFTVSCDLKKGTTTGISAKDRAMTVLAISNPESSAEDFNRPGHIFPLIAKAGGVLDREGHTEAAVDLAILAGCTPVGVICEIINLDGSMARGEDLEEYCKNHSLKKLTIAELKEYKEFLYTKKPVIIPTDLGNFLVETIDNPNSDQMPHLLIYQDRLNSPLNLRVHSECLTGDLLGSRR